MFGADPLFRIPKSTSNLAQPNFRKFLEYSKMFFDQKQYTNNGPLVKLLETRLANFHEAKFCVTFCSGFWALALAIKALALEGKTEVVMPSLTYRRLADIAAWTRLKPRFCEVDPNTLALNAETVQLSITDQTALIIAVHPIVNCCDVEGLIKLSNARKIPLLFDSVESVYESCNLGKVGQFGPAECFSLHASKLINGFEGGYLTTNDSELASRMQFLRGFGFRGLDHVEMPGGLNAKLNEVHAAMTLANLDEIDVQVSRHKQHYIVYQELLASIKGIRLVNFDERYKTSYKNILVELTSDWPLTREQTLMLLNTENILARAYYSPPLHLKKMAYPYIPTRLDLTETLSKQYVLMPCGELVSKEDILQIICFLNFLRRHASEISHKLNLMDGTKNG